mgnify:CR=1 FL=1
MKKLFILGLVLLASSVSAQSFVVSPFVGFISMQGYIENEYIGEHSYSSNAESALVGLESGVTVWNRLEFGLEFVYPFGYAFKLYPFETTYKIMQIGPYAKYYFKTDYCKPYLKTGLAYYWGKEQYKPPSPYLLYPANDYVVAGNWGINVGCGIFLDCGVFVQFDYNLIAQKKYFDMDTWDVRVGYQLSFGH